MRKVVRIPSADLIHVVVWLEVGRYRATVCVSYVVRLQVVHRRKAGLVQSAVRLQVSGHRTAVWVTGPVRLHIARVRSDVHSVFRLHISRDRTPVGISDAVRLLVSRIQGVCLVRGVIRQRVCWIEVDWLSIFFSQEASLVEAGHHSFRGSKPFFEKTLLFFTFTAPNRMNISIY